jgi:hypothetical protein
MWTRAVPALIGIAGIVAIVVGSWMLWPELGLVVAGVICVLGVSAWERGKGA